MVQVGRRRREAGRQPVRDRDRQGFDGGAVDHRRHAFGNPRAGGRRRAGRRRGRDHRRRGRGCRQRACAGPRRNEACTGCSAVRSRESGNPGLGSGSPLARGRTARQHLAYPNLDPFFEVRTPSRNFGPAKTSGGTSRHAAGAPSRRRKRHRPVAALAAPARAAASSRPTSRRRSAAARAAPRRRWRVGATAPSRSRRSTRTSSSRKCRSTACAAPSRRGWSRPSRPSRISISPPT